MREGVWHEGDVVRKLRTLAGWTLNQLAKASGVNMSVIHDLERGTTKDPKASTIDRVAAAFGLTGRELRNLVPTTILRFEPRASVTSKQIKPPASTADRTKPSAMTGAEVGKRFERMSPRYQADIIGVIEQAEISTQKSVKPKTCKS